ncbi:AAA family ATPase [Eggerthellaceae bacterium zg-893]|nr:AAA family ATPase [Eggerthellaceae bacterium zg-893]
MNIQQAKEQIRRAMVAYFAKDEFGSYVLPTSRQRPVFLLGAPGIGKTAIMEQIAQELEVGFVSYSMTHHTRQSALGLPFITQKTYGGVEYDVSEYTMSEIIGAVYDAMEATGRREGILFLDEINCVSETLNPAMLQFLQFKTFGRHKVPDGWIVVTAGNPPEYNRTAHDFDIATWDRLKRIEVEPDFEAWRTYALAAGVHPAVLTYLDLERGHFYRVETTVDGTSFVTARGWDDLSAIIKLYEANELPVDELLISQYVQHEEIAKHFSVYFDLFTKYRGDYQIDRIVAGEISDEVVERAQEAGFDERVSLMGLVLDAVSGVVRDAVWEDRATARVYADLVELRDGQQAAEGSAADALAGVGVGVGAGERANSELGSENGASAAGPSSAAAALSLAVREKLAAAQRKLACERGAGLLSDEGVYVLERAIAFFDAAARLDEGTGIEYDQLKALFSDRLDELDRRVAAAGLALDSAFAFTERAFGDGQEMLLLVTDLSVNAYTMAFINDHGCDAYFAHNQALLFFERGTDLASRIGRLEED